MIGMDPHSVLGVPPTADPEEVGRAYRELAKRHHPDRRPDDASSAQRMATINAAYALLQGQGNDLPGGRSDAADAAPEPAAPARTPRGGDAVTDERVRKVLGPEVLTYLHPDEAVLVVADGSTWDSPRTRLVVTDRRLVWHLIDAPIERVRSLPWAKTETVEGRIRGRLRKTGELLVQPKRGKRLSFGELTPDALQHVIARVPA